MKGVMIQGTASDVGKSLIVTALCRLFANEGMNVTPFKSQNMSNNSYVTSLGEEIGRAQGIQAEAAKTTATVSMNPILLKPRSEQHAEVVLLGKVLETMSGRGYRDDFYEQGLVVIRESLQQLENHYEWVVIEGAGSPVEINLMDKELVNMTVAEIADVPVILIADIDRGGIFASIVGTLELMPPGQRERVKGLLINKFRGDIRLFEDGIEWLEERTGIPVLGVLPYINHHGIDGEDSLSLSTQYRNQPMCDIDIAVIHLPYISNYSDIEPFSFESDVSIRLVKHPSQFGSPDAVIIPGTKSTIHDLGHLKMLGIDQILKNFAEAGGYIIGICGGYQMLGNDIIDETGTDSGEIGKRVDGLQLIPAQTIFNPVKETILVRGHFHPVTQLKTDRAVEGYEIHLGHTVHFEKDRVLLQLEDNREEGYYGNDGQIIGTYLHHLFHNDAFRNDWLNQIRKQKGLAEQSVVYAADLKESRYDQLAHEIKQHLDWEQLLNLLNHWEKK